MDEGVSDSKTIKSVENAIAIMEVIAQTDEIGVTALSDRVGLSKGTVHHYLTTLSNHDFVEQSAGRYRLGLRSLTYGGIAREREWVYRVGKDGIDRLAKYTEQTARLAVERGGYAVTLYQSTADNEPIGDTHLGSREPLYASATGKVLLSAMEGDARKRVLDRADREASAPPDRAQLTDELADIRRRGIAFDDEDHHDGIRCVATGLATEADQLLGAIAVSASVESIDDETFYETLPQEIRNVAGVIEINTTYRGWMD
ncbi:IclR family transcriptional regulator [Halocatena halophila]|uniref:IclR family transcriptional regulator n=1 Tax=Halocatena halophila TaxID=2814576 RepID=UPI002ED44C2F